MGVENQLVSKGIQCYCLDGDNMRAGLNKSLGFQRGDRQENIRRTAEVAKIVADSGQIVLCSLISPNEADRSMARMIMKSAKLPSVEETVNTVIKLLRDHDVIPAKSSPPLKSINNGVVHNEIIELFVEKKHE